LDAIRAANERPVLDAYVRERIARCAELGGVPADRPAT
jgi:hypothetical protein